MADLREVDDMAVSATARQPIAQAASDFLARKRIAITGVSRHPENHGSNVVYQRLRERGYQVFAVNPNASEVEGDRCFKDLRSIPDGVEAVVIGTRPDLAEGTMRECVELGIGHVWMHRSIGGGSVSPAAADYGREHGISVIAGWCPLMFEPVTDGAHRAMRFILTLTGSVPRRA
jgi:predicted CoA-binding protein